MKRVLAILLTALLSVCLLAGCNKAAEETKDVETAVGTTTAATTATATEAPTPEQYVDGYFKVIGGIETGTAGASLKEARAAVEAFAFAQQYSISTADYQTMRDNMLAAWESMTEEQQQDFDASFISVVELLKDLDADALPSVFEDAGVADQLKELLGQKNALENWETLSSNTLTMGNSEE